jgi:hypothetical protein
VALEIVYETIKNNENIFDYPKMYKVYKDNNVEVDKIFAEFDQAPQDAVLAYLTEFKSYVSDLILSIPDEPVASKDTEKKIAALLGVGSYLRSAMPTVVIEDEDTPSETN